MLTTVSGVAKPVEAAAATGFAAMFATGMGMPWMTDLAISVLGGSLVYLLRAHEQSQVARIVYFTISLTLGYGLAVWCAERWPAVPHVAIGGGCGVVLITAMQALFDWASTSLRDIFGSLGKAAADRLNSMIKGKKDD
jgi:hypothetical protein